jgi:hypothetical protein
MSTAKPYYIMTENGKQKLEAMMDDIPLNLYFIF